MSDLALGIDVGTSGVRIAAIDQDERIVAFAEAAMPAAQRDGHRITQDPAVWVRGLDDAMARLAATVDLKRVDALAVDGTSGTLVAVDAAGRPVATGSLYNDRADDAAIAAVSRAAPANSAAHGATSPLARAVRLLRVDGVARILHQADWIAGQMSGRFDVSDENNALKTGYDPVARAWPAWIADTGVTPDVLPAVVPVGTAVGGVSVEAAKRFGVPAGAVVVAGTTDGCAAFLATGAGQAGRSGHVARLHAGSESRLRPAGVCAGVRTLQPSDRRFLAGRWRLEYRRRRLGALLRRRGDPRNQPPY